MNVVLYDCRDHLNPQWRGCTLRVLDEGGAILLQGQVYGNARELGERIAAGLGAELKYVGPPSPVSAAGDGVDAPPVLVADVVVVHGPAEDLAGARQEGWLF